MVALRRPAPVADQRGPAPEFGIPERWVQNGSPGRRGRSRVVGREALPPEALAQVPTALMGRFWALSKLRV
jgi:hypothetical protein